MRSIEANLQWWFGGEKSKALSPAADGQDTYFIPLPALQTSAADDVVINNVVISGLELVPICCLTIRAGGEDSMTPSSITVHPCIGCS